MSATGAISGTGVLTSSDPVHCQQMTVGEGWVINSPLFTVGGYSFSMLVSVTALSDGTYEQPTTISASGPLPAAEFARNFSNPGGGAAYSEVGTTITLSNSGLSGMLAGSVNVPASDDEPASITGDFDITATWTCPST